MIETLRAAFAEALSNLAIVETGSDGAHWAAPVVALHGEPVATSVVGEDAVAVARSVVAGNGDAGHATYLQAQERRLLARAGQIDPTSIDEAREDGAYEGLAVARDMTSAEVLARVEAAGLRGRGGAYFPVHLKWQAAIDARARNGRPLLVVNAEEGEPGVFKDRVLMESDPHRLVEGVIIACQAIDADHAYIYINGQADLSAQRVAQAVEDSRAADLLGDLVIELRRGAGGYVCGEETVILESIEGRRAVPRLRPPFPTERGLFDHPTVINNVETLANLPDLFRYGADWFREVGSEDAPGTKLISLSGALPRPGLIEVPMGTTFAQILEIGGAGDLLGAVAGGPSGGLLPSSKFDVAIAPGALDPAGAVLGAGGIVAFDSAFGAAEVLRVQASYNAAESCGKCTPCREGGERLADAIERLRTGDVAAQDDIDELIAVMRGASLCGLGQMAVSPVTSALQDFSDEIGVQA